MYSEYHMQWKRVELFLLGKSIWMDTLIIYGYVWEEGISVPK